MSSIKNSNEKWSTYEANVQAYRSNFLSSQSILLAVGAISLGKIFYLTLMISIIGLFHMWVIWFRVIIIRTRIVDYHKFGFKKLFDNEGNLSNQNYNYLQEIIYSNNWKVRFKVNKNYSNIWERKPKKFTNLRTTRIKLDLLIPITLTLIWLMFIFYEVLI